MKIYLRKLSETEWDFRRVPQHGRRADIDGHIRLERGCTWSVDFFKTGVKHLHYAHLESQEVRGNAYGPNWTRILAMIQEFELRA